MNRIATICALALLVVSLGCRGDNPGTWPNDKVSAKMMESLNLTEITLSPDPSGGFSGTGKRADGETITVTVTQDADAHSISWSAKGDRGTVEEGSYALN